MKLFFYFAPDASGAVTTSATTEPTPPTKAPLSRAAYDRRIAAELSEATEVATQAQLQPFRDILSDEYAVGAQVPLDILNLASQARIKLGLANSGDQTGQADTAQKQALEDAMDKAIRRIQTGARLSFPDSLPDQRRYGIGIDLETAEDQVEILVPQIIKQLETETLRSVGTAQISALQTAFDAWLAAGGAQKAAKGEAQTDRAGGEVLLKQLRPLVREIKTCIDGEFPYNASNTPEIDIRVVRAKFHLPETQPFAPHPKKVAA